MALISWFRCGACAVLLLVSSSTLALASERSARVDAFVAEVVARNPTLQARTLARSAAGREAEATGLWPDPEAAVMLDQVPRRMEGEMPMLRYQLSQMIPWPGKLGLMEAAAQRRTDAAQADERTQALELVRDAKRAYWMLFLNHGLRAVNGAGGGLLDIIARAALARYGAGAGGHHDVIRAQVEQSALEVEAIDLAGERTATLAMMNALRNLPAATEIPDPDEPEGDARSEIPPPSRLERVALERRPELSRMRAMSREQESMAALARRERYPDFMTSVWYNQMLGGPDTAGVMLGASLPLFNLQRQNRRAEAADLGAGSAQRELENMQNMIRFEMADAQRKLETAQKTLELVREVAAPRAQQSFSTALAGYSTGSLEIVGVLDAWRALQAVERARVESLVARQMAIVDLERAIGVSLNEESRCSPLDSAPCRSRSRCALAGKRSLRRPASQQRTRRAPQGLRGRARTMDPAATRRWRTVAAWMRWPCQPKGTLPLWAMRAFPWTARVPAPSACGLRRSKSGPLRRRCERPGSSCWMRRAPRTSTRKSPAGSSGST